MDDLRMRADAARDLAGGVAPLPSETNPLAVGSGLCVRCSTEGHTVWNYPLPEATRPRWLAGGGNRVFVMNDHALYALPVV
ncbi:hypothetical protein [Streptomyces marispadix]|uniref:Uncharacterized protein n=1 Tax=Streptomyces marispadix TaxID=2922868 RepID=A0ABS9SVA0_9ACTN|nr:hypothetical protein [Streptomyces marispadix]MCH6160204.1 hypothetical protein [Streptomyces marispadix]